MENNQKEIQGWEDVRLTTEMSVQTLVEFLNVLNSRVAFLENLVGIPINENEIISITEYYKRQADEQANAQKEGE